MTLLVGGGNDAPYAHQGELQFSEVNVDETTGSVRLRATFPNPTTICCRACSSAPGSIGVRCRMSSWCRSRRWSGGRRQRLRLGGRPGPEGHAEDGQGGTGDRRQVAGDRGVAAGGPVVVEGVQKVAPGAQVTAVALDAKSRVTSPMPAWRPAAGSVRPGPRIKFRIRLHHVKVLHRQAGLRLGDRDRDHAGGRPEHLGLPIEQYPSIAPPSIRVSATYPGASAQTVEGTVTQVIEQQMNGLDHLRYISSNSDSSGADHADLQPGSRSRHCPGAGSEQAAARHARVCRRKCSSRASRFPRATTPS